MMKLTFSSLVLTPDDNDPKFFSAEDEDVFVWVHQMEFSCLAGFELQKFKVDITMSGDTPQEALNNLHAHVWKMFQVLSRNL